MHKHKEFDWSNFLHKHMHKELDQSNSLCLCIMHYAKVCAPGYIVQWVCTSFQPNAQSILTMLWNTQTQIVLDWDIRAAPASKNTLHFKATFRNNTLCKTICLLSTIYVTYTIDNRQRVSHTVCGFQTQP